MDLAPLGFRPLPLLRHPHLQTLLGHFLPGPRFRHPAREHVLRLPDGDALMLHDSIPEGWRPGGRIVLVVHGLTGSHASRGVLRVAALLLREGVRVVRMDLRGAGKGLPLARRGYTAADSEDVRAALAAMHHRSHESPLGLVGLSLGGNLSLKLAGEAADRPVPNLERIASVSAPIDVARCASLLALPRNWLYHNLFIRGLLAAARLRQQYFPDLPPLRFPRRMTTRLFDELYTAPRNGYRDALDYYHRASSFPHIARITTPTLILTARDDPFVAVEPYEELEPPENVVVRILPNGGHLGFVGPDGSGGYRWAETRMVEWMVNGRSLK
jgi:predicted alpha/beta-fold hydrolase